MLLQNPKNTIHGWFFTPDEIHEALSGNKMLNPSIDLTNACNLNCPYCYIEEKNSERKVRKTNELTLDESLSIIDDLAICGAKTINIVGAGEPTIDPHFEEIINHIYNQGLKTVLFTNGIRFYYYPKLLRLLYDRNVSIVLKYNSADSHKQDLVAGRKDYTVKRNSVLELLFDYGFNAHMPTRLGLDIIVFNGNVDEIVSTHEWCRKNNIFPIAAEYIPTGRTEDGIFQGYKALESLSTKDKEEIKNLLHPITNETRRILLQKIYGVDSQLNIKYNSHCAYYGGGICTQILGLYIDIEGNMWPCVARKIKENDKYIEKSLGNFRKGVKPSVIWQKNKYMKYIRSTYNGGCPYKNELHKINLE